MHDMKTLMASCSKGNNMANASVKHMEKYIHGLFLIFVELARSLYIGPDED